MGPAGSPVSPKDLPRVILDVANFSKLSLQKETTEEGTRPIHQWRGECFPHDGYPPRCLSVDALLRASFRPVSAAVDQGGAGPETRAPWRNRELARAWGLGSVGVRRKWEARLAKEPRSGALAESKGLTRGHNNDSLRVMHKDETWQFYRGEGS